MLWGGGEGGGRCETLGRRFASSSEEARVNQARRDGEAEWRNRKKDLIDKKGERRMWK